MIGPEHFDKLRKEIKDLKNTKRALKSVILKIVCDLERIQNQMTETEIDIRRHDKHGAVDIEW
jgi:uncharacterized coiled-coil DUF342 family protein